jgi:hypothetical protein
MVSPSFDVLLFACETREHLLAKAWTSYARALKPYQPRVILAIDGHYDHRTIDLVRPDLVVQNYRRRGYAVSAANAVAAARSEYVLWLEDDWLFNGTPRIDEAIRLLDEHPSWISIRWSKVAPLTAQDTALAPGAHLSSVGFSTNPCFCRTGLVRDGIAFIRDSPKGNTLHVDALENALTRFADDRGYVCAVFDPGTEPAIDHIGALESTGRQWHMTAALDAVPTAHLPVAGSAPPLWRRCWMILKLVRAVAVVAWKQLFSNAAYDLAFRIMASAILLRESRGNSADPADR